ETGRREAHEALGGLDHHGVQGGHARVPQAVDLGVDGGDDSGGGVGGVDDADAAAEVEDVATVDGVQVSAGGAVDDKVGVAGIGVADDRGVASPQVRGELTGAVGGRRRRRDGLDHAVVSGGHGVVDGLVAVGAIPARAA